MAALQLGIIGLGRGFMLTLPALRADPRVALAGAFDLRQEAREAFAKEFAATAYDSLDALLAAPQIDAVYIATPHELHADQAVAALRAGKHVLVEKPMATSVAACAAMERAARETGKVLVVGPSHGFDEPVRHSADLLASGKLGDVRMVTALNFTDFMFRPRRPEELDTARGGGVVYSQAAHQIDVVRRLVNKPVEAVRAVTGTWDSRRPSEGAYTALMTFEGGAAASLTYNGYGHYDSDELMGWISELGREKDPATYGDARRALAKLSAQDEADAKLKRTYGTTTAQPDTPAQHHEHFGFIVVSCEHGDIKLSPMGFTVYGEECREFVALAPPRIPRRSVIDEFVGGILGHAPPIHDGRWGLETMACCDALLRSAQTHADIRPAYIIASSSEALRT